MKGVHIISWAAILLQVLVLFSCCHTQRLAQTTYRGVAMLDSFAKSDTQRITRTDSIERTIYVHDTVVTVGGGGIILDLTGSDTIVHANHATLSVQHRNGREHVDCSCDSQDVVIKNLIQENVYRGYQVDSIAQDRTAISHLYRDTTSTLRNISAAENKGFFGKLYGHVRNVLALTGLAALIFFIVHLVKRFA